MGIELVARGEEKEIGARREQKRQERRVKRDTLDAVWDE